MALRAGVAQTEDEMKKNSKKDEILVAEEALERAVVRLREARGEVVVAITVLQGVRRGVRKTSGRSSRDNRKRSKSGIHGV